MNYYPHHIGDYAKDTAHLSMLEDGAYRRLLDLYYSSERPLPIDRAKLYRLVRALTKQDRVAVDTVVDEFFDLTDVGYSHKRCDTEIAKAKESTEETDAKKRNERERQERYRKRRREVFEALREYDCVPKWDTPMDELEALLSRHQSRASNAPVTRDRPSQSHDQPRLTNNQEPITNNQREEKAMSGKPDVVNGFRAKAIEVLQFLNVKTGRNYQAVDANLKLIAARLKEGATVEDCRAVVAKKYRDWSGDDKMTEYLRPATLFNATKFAQYRGELADGNPQVMP